MLKLVKRTICIKNTFNLMRCCSSIVPEKIDYFNNASSTWWDPNGPMKQLHLAHPHQVAFVCEQLRLKHGLRPGATADQPLTGYHIADVGCGVGMNSERLSLLGALVRGLDPVEGVIREARAHAQPQTQLRGRLEYVVSTAEEHRLTHAGHYDVVLAFFILEHIRNRQAFVDNCLALLKPNGSFFVGIGHRSLILSFYLLWHKYVSGLIKKTFKLPHTKFLKKDEFLAMVNKGHRCQLKGQKNLILPLDGKAVKITTSEKHFVFYHFVK